MPVIHVLGGAGNQFFQYAFGRAVSLASSPLPLSFHLSDNLGASGYVLDRYDLPISLTKKFSHMHREQGMQFNPWVFEFTPADDDMFVGFWQSELYFKDIAETIREELGAPIHLSELTHGVAHHIRKTNSVSIHVRRGDNLDADALTRHGDLSQTDYYQRAIEYVRARVIDPTFFIFSDDPEWCEANFRPEPSIVVSHNDTKNPCEDLWLMSQCRHSIIANSTFSWWGAWLNPNQDRVVVAPLRWFVTPARNSRDIVPARWVKL